MTKTEPLRVLTCRLLRALAPRRLLRLPKLRRPIQIIKEQACLCALIFGEAKFESLVWLTVAQNHDAMAPIQIQSGDADALVLWPRYYVLRVNSQREIP